jgi:hypothetical protein
MGDIALPDVNYQPEWGTKTNKPAQQEELEKLKKEVYMDGLQVEEEGLSDIIRKKIKQVSIQDALPSKDKMLNEAILVSLNLQAVTTKTLLLALRRQENIYVILILRNRESQRKHCRPLLRLRT